MTIIAILLAVLTASIFCCGDAAAQGAETNADVNVPRKKLIELGWDIPTVDHIAKHWREMEANAPFDGIMYDLTGKTKDGKDCRSQALFSKEEWDRASFEEKIAQLNSCEFQRFHENFIRINFAPANFDWDDDASWANVCDSAAICAWFARETNGEICLDFESYGEEIFHYSMGPDRTFVEAKALARRRGAEFCKAIVDEYPNVVLLCLWMNSINLPSARLSDQDSGLCAAPYGLLPSFIDGMLDSARPETIFVDGCERGYYMNGTSEYDRASIEMRSRTGGCVALVSPENRSKYSAQVEAGFGFYLDMYSNPPESVHYRGPEPGETRFDRLAANLRAAWNAADTYVWVYGEQKRWWAPENATSDDEWESWEETLPGLTDLQESLIDPDGYAVKIMARIDSSDEKDLLTNGDFSQLDPNGGFVGWSTWILENTPGKFVFEDGQAAMQDVSNACYLQEVPVEPNGRYLVVGKMKQEEGVVAHLTVRWQTPDGKWTAEAQDVCFSVRNSSVPDSRGLREAFGVVEVPEGVGKLALLLSAHGSKGGKGLAVFDDVRVYHCQ